jgi:hypothetical protein
MIRGACLCGALAYEARALSGPVTHCHCRTCQKAHSAAFATTARVKREAFGWTKGEAAHAAIESTPGKLRHFCPRCGSHLMAEWVGAEEIILRIGCVEEGLEARPVAHIWMSHAAPWDTARDDLPRYAEGFGSAIVA